MCSVCVPVPALTSQTPASLTSLDSLSWTHHLGLCKTTSKWYANDLKKCTKFKHIFWFWTAGVLVNSYSSASFVSWLFSRQQPQSKRPFIFLDTLVLQGIDWRPHWAPTAANRKWSSSAFPLHTHTQTHTVSSWEPLITVGRWSTVERPAR